MIHGTCFTVGWLVAFDHLMSRGTFTDTYLATLPRHCPLATLDEEIETYEELWNSNPN